MSLFKYICSEFKIIFFKLLLFICIISPFVIYHHISPNSFAVCQEATNTVDSSGTLLLPVLISPDSQWTARIHEAYCGIFAPGQAITYLTLTSRGENEDLDLGYVPLVLSDDDAEIPKLRWLDNQTLEIGLPQHVRVDELKPQYKSIRLKYTSLPE